MIATSHPHKAFAAGSKSVGRGASTNDPFALLNQLFRTASVLPPKPLRREQVDGTCEAHACPEPGRCAFAGCKGFCRPTPPAA